MTEDVAEHCIAIGLDGSAASWKAFDEAIFQAKNKNAVLHVVSIQEPTDATATYSANEVLATAQTDRRHLDEMHLKAKTQAEAAGVKVVTTILKGHFTAAIIDYVKAKKIELLILGGVGHSSIWGALLGTNVDKIVRNAPGSVLIVR